MPETYTITTPDGSVLGIGRLVECCVKGGEEDVYGIWNLSLLVRASAENPGTPAGHLAWVQDFQVARKLGAALYQGQSVASYAMLLSAPRFMDWLRGVPGTVLAPRPKDWLIHQYATLHEKEPSL